MNLIKVLSVLIYLINFTISQDIENIKDNINLECANNSTCLKDTAKLILSSLHKRKSLDFGLFKIEPIKKIDLTTGRSSSSTFLNLLNGHKVKIPLGPVVFSVQPSEEDNNYLEISLLKKQAGFEVK